jgi:hypothetical protein
MKLRWSRQETWWCVEVDDATREIGCARVWQDVLDRAAAIRRLGDAAVPGYTGLFRVRVREADRLYLVREGTEPRPAQPA